MSSVTPNAFVPRKKRWLLLACAGVSLMGAGMLWLSFVVWSFPLAAVGFLLMPSPILIRFRQYISSQRGRYESAMWVIFLIPLMYRLSMILLGPKEVPEAGLIGAGFFLVWAMTIGFLTYHLWRTGDLVEKTTDTGVDA